MIEWAFASKTFQVSAFTWFSSICTNCKFIYDCMDPGCPLERSLDHKINIY